ncbi:Piso0_004877 [Millerozyma farinosa CBS 7064]|uniref:Piso0_004877 protein n=1 Tax=Pichia sorbitophila (strain ATCC MYA-4447 / BCRC 22081 / CBS 7064 / NBRC 10061 / NRRL Y-12695) TaxID=559304 RepID=G8Y3M3_PICSO|nr:Piso0_004877 [Millerozyma farinosa CBS 7064]
MSEATINKLENDEQLGRGSGAGNSQFNSNSTGGAPGGEEDDEDEEQSSGGKPQKERRKIEIKFIQDKSRRHITFSKRKAGIMKKAYELSVLTGTQVLLLVVSETGLVYTFTTPKLQPLVTKSEGKNLIQACLNAPEEGLGDDQGDHSEGNSGESPVPSPVTQAGAASAAQQQAQQQAAHVHHAQQVQAAAQQQLPPGAHFPHGIPYPGAGHPQAGLPIPPQAYSDPNVYQQYFANMQNGSLPNQHQYQ